MLPVSPDQTGTARTMVPDVARKLEAELVHGERARSSTSDKTRATASVDSEDRVKTRGRIRHGGVSCPHVVAPQAQ